MGKKSKSKNNTKTKVKMSDSKPKEAKLVVDASDWLVRLETNEMYGNHFLAKATIPAGAIIGQDTSVLHVFAGSNKCVECGTPLDHRCVHCYHHEGKCQQVYCSRECQEWAWDHYHCTQDGSRMGKLVNYCKTGLTNTRLNTLITCKLIALYKMANKNAELVAFVDTLLATHQPAPMMKQVQSLDTMIVNCIGVFSTRRIVFLPDGGTMITRPDGDDSGSAVSFEDMDFSDFLPAPFAKRAGIIKILSLMLNYSFGKLDDASLMGPTNYFNHSCVPNAKVVNVSDECHEKIIEATRDIAANEQVYICYYDLDNTPPAIRRESLQMQHGFLCMCQLCLQDEEQPSCNACGKRPKKLRTCLRCNQCRYCNRECQKAHWPQHKLYCNKVAKLLKQYKENEEAAAA